MVFGEKMGKLLDDIDIMKRNMATKDDIKNMATKDDIKKIY